MADNSALLAPHVLRHIENAASTHVGRPWQCTESVDLADRSSHPAALLHGGWFSVFAKLLDGPDSMERAESELAGLELIARTSEVLTAVPIGPGFLDLGGSTVLLFEALEERPPAERSLVDWTAIGRGLATLHQVRSRRFGRPEDGFFGPLHQDNRPVSSNTWAQFYGERRLLPRVAAAVDAQQLPVDQARRIERIVQRLEHLVGPEPEPTLLHGDAQHHNFVSTSAGAVVVDPAPYYGHPEIDLALVDYFTAVPPELFSAYGEINNIDPGFPDRRELWRLFAYLSVLIVDGSSSWGRSFFDRLVDAISRYV